MKGKRFITLGIMISLLAVTLAGCGSKEGSVLDSAIKAANEAESIEAEGTFDVAMKMSAQGQEAVEMKMVGNMKMAGFTDPLKMKMNMDMEISGLEGLTDGEAIPSVGMETYTAEQDGEYVQYMKDDITGGGKWYKQVLGSADDMEEMQDQFNQLDMKMFMNGDYTYTEQPDAEENGKIYKVYTCTLTKEYFEKVMGSVGSMLGSTSGLESEVLEAVGDAATDLKFTIWIDEEEKQLYRVIMPMTDMMNQVMQKAMEQNSGSETDAMQMEVTKMDFDIKYTNYNSVEDFTVPEEALNAETLSAADAVNQ